MTRGGGPPGERVIWGAGPVREVIARKPSSVRVVWVDPQRAGRSARDPVADIVVAARTAATSRGDATIPAHPASTASRARRHASSATGPRAPI